MKVKFTKSTVAFLSLMLLTACASTSTNELVIPKELLVKVEENESTSFRLKRSYIFNIDLAGEDLNEI